MLTGRALSRLLLAATLLVVLAARPGGASENPVEPGHPASENDRPPVFRDESCDGGSVSDGVDLVPQNSSTTIKYVGEEFAFAARIPQTTSTAEGRIPQYGPRIDPPEEAGELRWRLHEGCITPSLDGTLYLWNLYPACARVVMVSYHDEDFDDAGYGMRLGSASSSERCPREYGQYTVGGDITSGYSSALVTRVVITFEVSGPNGWDVLATRTRTIE